jgi:hypothetical protein
VTEDTREKAKAKKKRKEDGKAAKVKETEKKETAANAAATLEQKETEKAASDVARIVEVMVVEEAKVEAARSEAAAVAARAEEAKAESAAGETGAAETATVEGAAGIETATESRVAGADNPEIDDEEEGVGGGQRERRGGGGGVDRGPQGGDQGALWRVRILVVGRVGVVVDLEHLRGHVLDCVAPPSQFCLRGRVDLSLVDHGVLLHLRGRGCVRGSADGCVEVGVDLVLGCVPAA